MSQKKPTVSDLAKRIATLEADVATLLRVLPKEMVEQGDHQLRCDADRNVFHGLLHVDAIQTNRRLEAVELRLSRLVGTDVGVELHRAFNRWQKEAESRVLFVEERAREVLGEAFDKPEVSLTDKVEALEKLIRTQARTSRE